MRDAQNAIPATRAPAATNEYSSLDSALSPNLRHRIDHVLNTPKTPVAAMNNHQYVRARSGAGFTALGCLEVFISPELSTVSILRASRFRLGGYRITKFGRN